MSTKLAVLIIFIIALLPRIMLAAYSVEEPIYDAKGYDARAVSIWKYRVFGDEGKPTSVKPPLYSFFLALIYRVFGHSYLAVRIMQSFLGALSCVIIYFIALKLINRNVALVSGLLSGINISFIKSSSYLLSEAFSTFLISLLILSLVSLSLSPGFYKRIWVGFLAGLVALTRSEMVFFLPFLYAVGFSISYLIKRFSLWLFLKDSMQVFIIFFIIISLWTFRNWRVYHTFIPLTTAAGINLYSSYCPPEGKLFGFTSDDHIVDLSRSIHNEAEESRFLTREALKFIRNNPKKLPRLEFLKFAFFWSVFDWEIIGNGVYNFSFGFMLPFFIWGILAGIRKWQNYFLLYLPILYFQIITLLLYGSPRFRVPCEPFIIIFSSIGIMCFFQKFTKNIFPTILLVFFFMLNLTAYFYSPLVKDYLKCALVKFGLW